jgi:hypothetical protein
MLTYLTADVENNPGKFRALPAELETRMAILTSGIKFDSDEAIDGKIAL